MPLTLLWIGSLFSCTEKYLLYWLKKWFQEREKRINEKNSKKIDFPKIIVAAEQVKQVESSIYYEEDEIRFISIFYGFEQWYLFIWRHLWHIQYRLQMQKKTKLEQWQYEFNGTSTSQQHRYHRTHSYKCVTLLLLDHFQNSPSVCMCEQINGIIYVLICV